LCGIASNLFMFIGDRAGQSPPGGGQGPPDMSSWAFIVKEHVPTHSKLQFG
jgi:hypothetical protein